MKIKKKNIQYYTLWLFLFFSMFFPTAFSVVRLILLLINIFIILMQGRINVNRNGAMWIYILLFSNLVSLIVGIINNAPGALRSVTIEFIWPILFFVLLQNIRNQDNIKIIVEILVQIFFIIVVFDVMYLLTSLLGVNIGVITPLYRILECNFGNYGFFYQYTTTHMCTIIYMFPFILALFFEKKDIEIINRKMLVCELGLGAICVIMSGRVALILVATFSLVIIMGIKVIIKDKNKTNMNEKVIKIILVFFVFGIVFPFVIKYLNIDLREIWNYVVYKIHSSQNTSDAINGVRKLQANALIKGWFEKPILGHGTGSYTKECIRSKEMPWTYEYTYLAMLFQKGLLGTSVFGAFVIRIFCKMIYMLKNNIVNRSLIVPFIVGLFSILVATAADPYLMTFGCLWMLYIPFAISNCK